MRIAKRSLKKQSQFAPALNSAKSYMKGDYGNTLPFGAQKNKAKQTRPELRRMEPNLANQGCSGPF